MKNYFTALFCFASMLLFAQKTYHFDYYVSYNSETLQKDKTLKSECHNLVNSKNQDISAKIIKRKRVKTELVILDYPNEILHYFKLKKENFPFKNEDFVYVKSEKLTSVKKQFDEEFKNRAIKVVSSENHENVYEYEIEENNETRTGKYQSKAHISFKKYKDNLAFNGLEKLFDFYGAGKKITLPENMIFMSGTIEYDDTKSFLELKEVEPLEITLHVK